MSDFTFSISITAGTALSVITNIFELLLLFSGYTLLNDRSNLVGIITHFFIILEILFHLAGITLYVWFIFNSWKYDTIWALWSCFWYNFHYFLHL